MLADAPLEHTKAQAKRAPADVIERLDIVDGATEDRVSQTNNSNPVASARLKEVAQHNLAIWGRL